MISTLCCYQLNWPENCNFGPECSQNNTMKNRPVLESLLLLCLLYCLSSCSKSSHAPSSSTPTTTVSFSAGDSTIIYPLDLAYIQDVDSTHTTLISAEFP